MSAFVPTYCPELFIREVGNASARLITRVIEERGFGTVRKVDFRGNNAVVYMDRWDIPNTRATRILLQEGEKPLLLYYDDYNRFWEVVAYKTRQQRDHDLCDAHDKKKIIEEQKIQEQKIQEPKKPEESWIARTIRLAKEKAETEKQNVDPMQKEYDALRAALIDIHSNALKQGKEDAPMLMKQRQEIIEAHEREDARLEALRLEKEEIERQIEEFLEQEREESERLEKERLEKERIEELAKELETITLVEDETVSEYIPEVLSIDYGNATQNYSATRNSIRKRIGVA